MIAAGAIIEAGAELGRGVIIEDFVVVRAGARIGNDCRLRAGTVVYGGATLAAGVQTGHHAVIRAGAVVGVGSTIGSHVVLDGELSIGQQCRLQSSAYVPSGCRLGDRCFLGPGATLTNDRRAGSRMRGLANGETIHLGFGVRIGARAVVLSGLRLHDECFVAAGAVVTRDVGARRLVRGVPAVDVGEVPEAELFSSALKDGGGD